MFFKAKDDFFRKFPELADEEYQLRSLQVRDWPFVFDLYNDPLATQYNYWQSLKTPRHARQKIRQYQAEFRRREKIRWAICLKINRLHILGNIVVGNFSEDKRKAEIGFNLLTEYREKGIMQKNLHLIINYLFLHTPLQRLEACVVPENTHCIRFLEKMQFEFYKPRAAESPRPPCFVYQRLKE
jgi:ribosomal-protein-alanine N-acetyltransferase